MCMGLHLSNTCHKYMISHNFHVKFQVQDRAKCQVVKIELKCDISGMLNSWLASRISWLHEHNY